MEYIDSIFYRKINPSDFKKLYDIDKPEGGGGQTYLEAAGISNESIVDFLQYAEISDSPLEGETRSIYTFYAHVLGNSSKAGFIEFAPRKGRTNYRISRQNMKYKHPAWAIDNGFPEPSKDRDGNYTSEGNFAGIIDNLLIIIIRTTYKKYYAGYINLQDIPESWPHGIGLEAMFEGDRRGVLSITSKSVVFEDSLENPFGRIIDSPLEIQVELEETEAQKATINYLTGFQTHFSRNRIVFGAPGTGKSFTLNKEKDELLESGGVCERVTFHPDYSYANFVGTYKPVPVTDESGNSVITYKFVPGPFMRVYVEALKNSREGVIRPHLLLIEEINRANVAAVFGDVFQLLDRNDEGVSEYPICATEDIKAFLAEELDSDPSSFSEISLPDNMFIWATMNSADQGVFPMDTAFKRRWDFTYIGINASEEKIVGKTVVLGTGENERLVEWNELRRAINDRLSTFKINEDKLMGPYFLSRKIIPENAEIDRGRFVDAFKNKVLMYLFDDAAKQKRPSLFADGVDTTKYSAVCKAFDVDGVFAFCSEISSKFTTIPDRFEGEGDPQ